MQRLRSMIACALLAAAPAVLAKELRAAAGSVELQPPMGMAMAGFGARTGTSTGVLDPLHAKILVLEGKDRTVAIVTLDLVGVLPIPQLDSIRARVKSATGIEDVIFNASHTHSGPYIVEHEGVLERRPVTEI